MRTKVDKYARLVVPESMGENLGLTADTPVDVKQEGEAIIIRPATEGELLEKHGLLIYTGRVVDEDPEASASRARRGRESERTVSLQAVRSSRIRSDNSGTPRRGDVGARSPQWVLR